jgi:hypothetical protein
MESQVKDDTHIRFLSANKELRGILRQAEGAAKGACQVTDADFQTFSHRLSNCDFSIGDASRAETLDAELRSELAEYIRNFRAIQQALEKVRVLTLARRMRLETTKPHFDRRNGQAKLHSLPE